MALPIPPSRLRQLSAAAVLCVAFFAPVLAQGMGPNTRSNQAAPPPDNDTVCASVYTYLAQAARQNGMAGGNFDMAAIRAQNTHLASNPGEDSERYSLSVIDGASAIASGLARGAVSSATIMSTAQGCNTRYMADSSSANNALTPSLR